jgi:hypothetical protein
MRRPTLRDIRFDQWSCPSLHWSELPTSRWDLVCEVIEELERRIEALEPEAQETA